MSIIKKQNSENYGEYIMECIGIVDFAEMIFKLGAEDYGVWSDEFHPLKFFGSCSLIRLADMDFDDYGLKSTSRCAVFVASEEANKNWDSKYWQEKYNMPIKKVKLPIAKSNNEIAKWQKSNPLYLTPDYFVNSKNLEDLQENLLKGFFPLNVSNINIDLDDNLDPLKKIKKISKITRKF